MVAFHPITPELVDPAWAEHVAAPAVDTLSPAELKALAARQPSSVLHVIGLAPHGEGVAFGGASGDCLERLRAAGAFRGLDRPALLLYRVEGAGHVQVGLVGDLEVADCLGGGVRRHEHTEVAKEAALGRDREQLGVDTSPLSVAYPPDRGLDARLSELVTGAAGWQPPAVSVTVADGTRHDIWPVTDPETVTALTAAIRGLDVAYLLDGHHRVGAAARHAERAGAGDGGPDDPGRVLAALFPREQVRALDYRRVVRRPAGLDGADLLAAVRERFTVSPLPGGGSSAQPRRRGEISLWLEGRWYRLVPRAHLVPGELPGRLDETIVQHQLLEPVLDVTDPRTSAAISYVPGTVPLTELERRVATDEVVVALCPLPLTELEAVADAGVALPPKATYFTPKLAAGLMLQRRRVAVPAAG